MRAQPRRNYSSSTMLRFSPYYEPKPWGGQRLQQLLGRDLPEGPIGEAWELSEVGQRHSIVCSGPLQGKTLGELWRTGALGGSGSGQFPFLLKWLDTHQWLSVQVHPTEAGCQKLGHGAPKTEAWCLAHVEHEAAILAGHYPGLDAATLRMAARGGTLRKWLYEVRPRSGEMILLPAGALHALGPGLVVLEVQQPSDTTFRVYDWGRTDANGEPRAMHLEEALATVGYDSAKPPASSRGPVCGPTFKMETVVDGRTLPSGPLRVLAAHLGPARVSYQGGEETLERGDVVVVEPADGDISLVSGTCVWLTEPSLGA